MLNMRKAAIIGCGFVGSATAFSLMHQGLFTELVLVTVVAVALFIALIVIIRKTDRKNTSLHGR